MKFKNHLRGWITSSALSVFWLYQLSYVEMWTNECLIFWWLIILFSIMNDLDSVHSKIWKLLLPISILFHWLSILLYKIFYSKSYKTRKRLINENFKKEAWFFSRISWSYKKASKKQLFNVTHRMYFHTELWILTFLWIAYFIDINYLDFNNLYYFAITIWYLTHLLLDWIHGKLPIFLTIRIIYMILWKRKEVYWLNKRIW